MKKFMIALPALAACFLVSCAYSIHPLNEAQQNFAEPHLPGTWSTIDDKGKEQLIIIRNTAQQAYKAAYTNPEAGRTYVYAIHLVRLGGSLFGDATLEGEAQGDGSTAPLPAGAIALHMFFRVTLEGDKMGIATLDEQWLKNQMQSRKLSIAHEDADDYSTILTASTPELQKLLAALAGTDGAFGETVFFTRKEK